MFESILIKKTKKILTEPQYKFLKQLAYWSLNSKDYGLKKDRKTWIYNTYEQWAEQLHFSVSTVRRSIKALNDLGFISLDYLSSNKRNRTLYYSINFDVIEEFLNKKNAAPSVHFLEDLKQPNEHISEHMYIDNRIQGNKSNKSINQKIFGEKIGDETKVVDKNSKPTVVQDMIKIWNHEFPNQKIISGSTKQTGVIHLTKQLARFLVAAIKLKFENSLEKWKRYLRLIKTSAYLMGEKFKLSVMWVIKFLTIDRIRAGELGVDESKIQIDPSEIEQKAIAHADSVEECETCKLFRHEIIKKLSPAVYLSWFTKVDLIDESKKMTIKAANDFVRDYIKANFLEKLTKESQVCFENLRKN